MVPVRLAMLDTQVYLKSAENTQKVVNFMLVKELSWKYLLMRFFCLLLDKVLCKLEQGRNIQHNMSIVSTSWEDLCGYSGFL